CRIVLLDVVAERGYPGTGRDYRSPRMSSCHGVCEHLDQPRVEATRVGQVIERLRIVEAMHRQHPLDRCTLAAERERTVASHDRHHLAVDLGCERPVGLDFFQERGFALLEG